MQLTSPAFEFAFDAAPASARSNISSDTPKPPSEPTWSMKFRRVASQSTVRSAKRFNTVGHLSS
jgi:hypothetical protein